MQYGLSLKAASVCRLHPKRLPTSGGCFIVREFGESSKMRTQMTVRQDGTGALIDDARQWHAIDWKRAQREVRRLQMRIAKAVKEAKPGKVKALQWLVTHSFR